jgi:hypothetical protein
MEMKQYQVIEVTKGDSKFAFQILNGSTYGNAIDAAFDILQKLNELSQQASQNMKPVVATQMAEEID